VERWKRLAEDQKARELPDRLLVVIGPDHEAWIDRRHLGPQGGVGVVPWNPQAKARRDAQRKGTKDRTLALIDSLKASYPARFGGLEPPKRTFTTFARVLDSQQARAHIGIDVDESGNVVLRRGEQSLRILESILKDLRKTGQEKLTSRRIHSTPQIIDYLDQVEDRAATAGADDKPVTLAAAPAGATDGVVRSTRGRVASVDILKTFNKPKAPRPRRIFEELQKARRSNMPNAAMILTRVLLELSADHYAQENGLSFAGDRNAEIEQEVQDFHMQLNLSSIRPRKSIRNALKFAASRPLSLGDKLEHVIRDLISKRALDSKEGNAKIRELSSKNVVELLNDAVHRLQNTPSIERVNHILELMQPVFNAMTAL
jgi:hypothetical protein